jgi:hypothetical protein
MASESRILSAERLRRGATVLSLAERILEIYPSDSKVGGAVSQIAQRVIDWECLALEIAEVDREIEQVRRNAA